MFLLRAPTQGPPVRVKEVVLPAKCMTSKRDDLGKLVSYDPYPARRNHTLRMLAPSAWRQ
jgi:hypothetical protein